MARLVGKEELKLLAQLHTWMRSVGSSAAPLSEDRLQEVLQHGGPQLQRRTDRLAAYGLIGWDAAVAAAPLDRRLAHAYLKPRGWQLVTRLQRLLDAPDVTPQLIESQCATRAGDVYRAVDQFLVGERTART